MALIGLCSGADRPRTLADYMRTRLGDVEWNHRYTVQIPIRRGGIAQWVVYVDGVDVRAVKLGTPAVLHEGWVSEVNISKQHAPKLVGI